MSARPPADPIDAADRKTGRATGRATDRGAGGEIDWEDAWRTALYGPDGFYARPEGPAGHFRTASHAAAGLLAEALTALAASAGCGAVLDVGAGRGELLTALATAAPHLRPRGVDVVARPPGLPPAAGWSHSGSDGALGDPLGGVPDDLLDGVLVVAWELLDVVPCPILEVDGAGLLRRVRVRPDSGRERLGEPAHPDDLSWCARWWPLDGAPPGTRVEIGRPRDELWAAIAGRVRSGLLLAVDYAHTAAERPRHETLTGYRAGRQVTPVPDGSCDITAHVAMDAVAAAAQSRGAAAGRLTTQRAALIELGITGAVTPGWGRRDSGSAADLLADLARAGQAAELLDPGGLGGFTWLMQPVPAPSTAGIG